MLPQHNTNGVSKMQHKEKELVCEITQEENNNTTGTSIVTGSVLMLKTALSQKSISFKNN